MVKVKKTFRNAATAVFLWSLLVSFSETRGRETNVSPRMASRHTPHNRSILTRRVRTTWDESIKPDRIMTASVAARQISYRSKNQDGEVCFVCPRNGCVSQESDLCDVGTLCIKGRTDIEEKATRSYEHVIFSDSNICSPSGENTRLVWEHWAYGSCS